MSSSESDVESSVCSNSVVTELMVSGSAEASGSKKKWPRFEDLGAMDAVLDELKKVIDPLYGGGEQPGGPVVAGVLLRGPPGSGKTMLAKAIAVETAASFYLTSATEFASGKIFQLFSQASASSPSIVFIDDLNAIPSINIEQQIVNELTASVRNFQNHDRYRYLLLIASTSRRDRAFMGMPCFQHHLTLPVPDEAARLRILSVLTRGVPKLEADLVQISRLTPHFVGDDLKSLVTEAVNKAWARLRFARVVKEHPEHLEDWYRVRLQWNSEQLASFNITQPDFEYALEQVQPYFRKEGFLSIPDVNWEDIGGLVWLKREFDSYIATKCPETAYLLYGPPGCGKRLAAKAVANEAGVPFIQIKATDLIRKDRDTEEGELAVRTIFSNARACSPCILFFHEIDILERRPCLWILEQLVVELHDTDERKGLLIIGSTYREDVNGQAVSWPSSFGKRLHVPLPDKGERGLILKVLSRNRQLDADVDLLDIAGSKLCEGLSGAKLEKAMFMAERGALDEQERTQSAGDPIIKAVHLKQALER